MTQLRDAARQALDALVNQFDGRCDAIDILSAALADEELRSDESRDMFLSAAIAGLLACGTYHTLVPQRAADVADMVASLIAGEQK
jgi:hypothetical protein